MSVLFSELFILILCILERELFLQFARNSLKYLVVYLGDFEEDGFHPKNPGSYVLWTIGPMSYDDIYMLRFLKRGSNTICHQVGRVATNRVVT